MTKTKFFLMILISSIFASFAGAAAGFYAAVSIPSVSNVAVLDIDSLAKSIDPSDKDYAVKAQALSDKTKQITQQLTDSGMVILDRAHVIAAPQESIIHVDLFK